MKYERKILSNMKVKLESNKGSRADLASIDLHDESKIKELTNKVVILTPQDVLL